LAQALAAVTPGPRPPCPGVRTALRAMASVTSTEHGVGSLDSREIEPQVLGAAAGVSLAAAGGGLRMRSPNSSPDPGEQEEWESVDQEVLTQNQRKWGIFISLASAADVVISGIIIIVSFSFAYRANGVSLYSMGIQAISHFISSLLLALRFKGELSLTESGGMQGLLRKQRRTFLVREQILSESMGIVMLISATALLFKALRKIKFWDQWYLDHQDMDKEAEWATEFLAWYGFAVYTLQAIFRFLGARKLQRSILWHGFVASVVSLVFLFVLGFAASYEKEWSWKAEPIAAIALSLVTLVEGIRIIILHLDDMDDRLRFDPKA